MSKRTFDLVLAGAALIVLAPVFAAIAALIKLDSRGPIFFGQVRVGRNRRLFRMWKFRKMHHNLPEQGPNLTCRDDARLTRIGRLLERTKLDELPQFFNVLAGDMSIIGPRPEIPLFVAHYPEQWDRVLAVKPGIFGPCQIRFRNESELYPPACTDLEGYYIRHILPEKLALDAAYASRRSLLSDVRVLVHAVLTCLGGVWFVTLPSLWRKRRRFFAYARGSDGRLNEITRSSCRWSFSQTAVLRRGPRRPSPRTSSWPRCREAQTGCRA
jgi:lipopolysaccharide/colanic/teichoic acid biosynthesis glycosyltransferase